MGLTLTLILLTFFNDPQFGDLMTFPSLFGIFMVIDALVIVIIYKLVVYFRKDTIPEPTKLGNVASYDDEHESEKESLENML